MAFFLYFWPSPYTGGLLSILLAFSLYGWPSLYTTGFLPIRLAFSLYFPHNGGLLILLAFPYSACWPSPYTVGLLPILRPSPYTVGLLPILLAFSLYMYCWLSPYTCTVGLLPILLALCWLSSHTHRLSLYHLQHWVLISHVHECTHLCAHTHTHRGSGLYHLQGLLGSYFSLFFYKAYMCNNIV